MRKRIHGLKPDGQPLCAAEAEAAARAIFGPQDEGEVRDLLVQKMRRLGLVALLLAASSLFCRAYAGDYSGVSFGPRAMFYNPQDSSEQGKWFPGVQLRFRGDIFVLEGSIDYRRTYFEDNRVDIYPVQASLLAYLLPGSPISPYILGGAGWYFTHVNKADDSDSTQNRFGPHAGAGLEIFFNESWSLDGSYRYVWLEKINGQSSPSLLDKQFEDRGHMITAALNYHF